MTLRYYDVTTPEYGTVVPILDDGSGPTEYAVDYLLVQAPNAKAAKVAAVKRWRKDHRSYINGDRDCCPFTGLKAERRETENILREELDDPDNFVPWVRMEVEL